MLKRVLRRELTKSNAATLTREVVDEMHFVLFFERPPVTVNIKFASK